MLPQQRVYAVEPLTMTAVSSLAGAYLGSCGLSLVASGMDSNGLASNIQRLIQEFLDTELGGISIQDWLVGVWDLSVIGGKIFIGRPLTNEFVNFAQWVAGKYGTQVGENVVYSDYGIKCADGSMLYLSTWHLDSGIEVLDTLGSKIPFDFSDSSDTLVKKILNNGYSFEASSSRDGIFEGVPRYHVVVQFYFNDSELLWSYSCFYTMPEWLDCTFALLDSGALTFLQYYHSGPYAGQVGMNRTFFYLTPEQTALLLSGTDFSLDRVLSLLYIPEGIEAEQGIALDVGAAATMDHDQVLQSVLDKILTGTLSPTMEVAGEAVVNPPAEEIADVEGLGLPTLGAALTSRFPFSIPWDFFWAVQLLAAPAKAPYFEVDFMEPLADKVGGWQGSTKVVLDFGQYAIIGQISRWTSTIGFCLMLAGSTKRLIWTA